MSSSQMQKWLQFLRFLNQRHSRHQCNYSNSLKFIRFHLDFEAMSSSQMQNCFQFLRFVNQSHSRHQWNYEKSLVFLYYIKIVPSNCKEIFKKIKKNKKFKKSPSWPASRRGPILFVHKRRLCLSLSKHRQRLSLFFCQQTQTPFLSLSLSLSLYIHRQKNSYQMCPSGVPLRWVQNAESSVSLRCPSRVPKRGPAPIRVSPEAQKSGPRHSRADRGPEERPRGRWRGWLARTGIF